MNLSRYIVKEPISRGTKHAFGIPGGVILRLLEAMNESPDLTPHLCFHEQDAGFAALGYAQAGGKLGVAYATRGPGITNMVTCIAEAYQESLPVLFITAHGRRTQDNVRFNQNQELDIASAVSGFTKFAANAESADEAAVLIKKAADIAMDGRRGPVLIDILSSEFNKEVSKTPDKFCGDIDDSKALINAEAAADSAAKLLSEAKRPVLLIGDGLRYSVSKQKQAEIISALGIPVLSSRGSQDLAGGFPLYFGYVGSHGVRYSNFILSKADLIIAVGNRMAFPFDSASFSPVLKNARILRVDIDENELSRHIPDEHAFACDGGLFLEKLTKKYSSGHFSEWIGTCRLIKKELVSEDCTETVKRLSDFISAQPVNTHYVCDVGNNEFLFSRAYELSGSGDPICCSKSFGTLGSAIGRAIGVYYAVGGNVVCVCGDQGFQYNLQELQYISAHRLPIKTVLLNNSCSGMIADHEKVVLGDVRIHVDESSGYSTPDFKKTALCFGIAYTQEHETACGEAITPLLYEIRTESCEPLTPTLPKGNPCQDMFPLLDRTKYQYLENL